MVVGKIIGDEVEGEVKVGEGEVGEEKLDELIDEFDVEEDFVGESVVCGYDLVVVDEGVYGGEEGIVELVMML